MAEEDESKLGWATAGAWTSVALLLLIILGQIFGWWEGLRVSLSGISLPTLPGAPTWFGRIGGFFTSLFKGAGGVISSVLVAVILLIPDTAVLGGFVADLANGQARYSVTSAFGLLAGLLNWVTLYFAGSTAAATRYSFGSAQAAAAASGLVIPNGVVGTGVRSGTVAAMVPLTGAAILNAPFAGAAGAGEVDFGDDASFAGTPAPPPREPGGAGSAGRSVDMSDMTSLAGGRRRKQFGGASYALNPSSILGIPLGSKAQPAGLAVLVAIAMIYSLDAIMGKRYGSALAFQIIFAIAIVCGYAFSYYTTEGFGSGLLWIVPLVIGLVVGGIGYVVMRQTGPQFLPLDPETTGTPTGEYSKCAKAAGGGGGAGEYVCDAYLNGQRIGTVSS